MPKLVNPPACPRCGYDFQGTISTWSSSCPLHGTCSECGLEFDWSEVLNPVLRIPSWFLEHPYRRVWRTFMPTYLRCFVPHRFWSMLRLSFPVLSWRLVQFAAEIVVTFHVILAYLVIAATYGLTWPVKLLSTPINEWLNNVLRLAVFPYRDWVLDAPPFVGAGAGFFVLDVPTPFDPAAQLAALMFILTPIQFVLLRRSMQTAKVRPLHLLRVSVYSLAPLPWILVVYVLIRMSDGWRWTIFTGSLETVARVLSGIRDLIELAAPLPVALSTIVFLWLNWCWTCAIRRYLRLPHALGVSLGITIIALLQGCLMLVLGMHHEFVRAFTHPY